MRLLWGIADFGRAMQRQMRFGELSRAPLRLLRLEWRGDVAECDWLARPADEWDRDLPRQVSDGNVSEQALRDAIAMRELLFDALPGVDTASLRVFRPSAGGATRFDHHGLGHSRRRSPSKSFFDGDAGKAAGFSVLVARRNPGSIAVRGMRDEFLKRRRLGNWETFAGDCRAGSTGKVPGFWVAAWFNPARPRLGRS